MHLQTLRISNVLFLNNSVCDNEDLVKKCNIYDIITYKFTEIVSAIKYTNTGQLWNQFVVIFEIN